MMTINGWVQIALFSVIVILITRPLGGYMTRVFAGERTFLSPVLQPDRTRGLLVLRRRRERGTALAHLCGRGAVFQRRRLSELVRAAAAAVVSAVQPAGTDRRRAEQRLQHLSQLCHQHELAVLCAGNHDGLPRANGRADGAQLRLGGDRHRAGAGANSRLRTARGQDDRQFLGRSDPLHALRAAADLDRGRLSCWFGRGCRRTWAPTPRRRRSKGAKQIDRAGSGRLAGGHQGCSAPMAAGSSIPTRRIRSRTRMR